MKNNTTPTEFWHWSCRVYYYDATPTEFRLFGGLDLLLRFHSYVVDKKGEQTHKFKPGEH